MVTPTMNTVMKMLESLPESQQKQVAKRLRGYIADLQDEQKWDRSFTKTQTGLAAAAKRARKEIAEGKATTGIQPAMKSLALPSFWEAYEALDKSAKRRARNWQRRK